MGPPPLALIPPLALAFVLLAWPWDGLFRPDAPTAPSAEAVSAAIESRLSAVSLHPATAALYRQRLASGDAAVWADSAGRADAAALLTDAPADGVAPSEVHADAVPALRHRLEAAAQTWERHDAAARDTLPDPRPDQIAALDVALTDGLLRYGDALRGRRTDPTALYTHSWFPTVRDSTGEAFGALARAVVASDARAAADALGALRPPHDGYARLRERLAALLGDLAPVPAGPDLAPGATSVRVPHVRARLLAFGYLAPDTLGAWTRPKPSRRRWPRPPGTRTRCPARPRAGRATPGTSPRSAAGARRSGPGTTRCS